MAGINFGFKPTRNAKNYVFISYAHADAPRIAQTVYNLNMAGIQVWYDEALTPGHKFTAEIADRIENCGCFIAFVSRNYVKSAFCCKETSWASTYNKNIFPVFIEEVREMPKDLNFVIHDTQYYEAFRYSVNEAIPCIISVAQDMLNGVPVQNAEWRGKLSGGQHQNNECAQLIENAEYYTNLYRQHGNRNDMEQAFNTFSSVQEKYPSDVRGWAGELQLIAAVIARNVPEDYNEAPISTEKISAVWRHIGESDRPKYAQVAHSCLETAVMKDATRLRERFHAQNTPSKENLESWNKNAQHMLNSVANISNCEIFKDSRFSDIGMMLGSLVNNAAAEVQGIYMPLKAQADAEAQAAVEKAQREEQQEQREIHRERRKKNFSKAILTVLAIAAVAAIAWMLGGSLDALGEFGEYFYINRSEARLVPTASLLNVLLLFAMVPLKIVCDDDGYGDVVGFVSVVLSVPNIIAACLLNDESIGLGAIIFTAIVTYLIFCIGIDISGTLDSSASNFAMKILLLFGVGICVFSVMLLGGIVSCFL